MGRKALASTVALVALLCISGGYADATDGHAADTSTPSAEESVPSAAATLTPVRLSRTRATPATLAMRLASPPVQGKTPVLNEVDLELSPRVSFDTHGLKSCDDDTLYTPSIDARKRCADSLVGHGSVTSEIYSSRSASWVTVTGSFLAFYSDYRGRRLLYAQVRTPEPVGLLYVIPFTIEKSQGKKGPELFVPAGKMRGIAGICISKRPDCFNPPYDLEDFYDRISELSLTLHRVFRSEGTRRSVVDATCSAPKGTVTQAYTLMKATLTYAAAEEVTIPVGGSCRPSAP